MTENAKCCHYDGKENATLVANESVSLVECSQCKAIFAPAPTETPGSWREVLDDPDGSKRAFLQSVYQQIRDVFYRFPASIVHEAEIPAPEPGEGLPGEIGAVCTVNNRTLDADGSTIHRVAVLVLLPQAATPLDPPVIIQGRLEVQVGAVELFTVGRRYKITIEPETSP